MKGTILGFLVVLFVGGKATYDLSRYERIGCYSTVVNESRILFTDVDRESDKWSGYTVNWYHWGSYLKGLVWHCGQQAKKKNLAYFGIQNIGECWARSSPLPYSSSPYSSSAPNCVNTGYNSCPANPSRSDTCAGRKGSSFVYHNPGVYACSRKLDIVIAVDASASISADQFNKVKEFLRRLVASFAISEDTGHFIIFHFDKQPANSTVSSFKQAQSRSRSGVNEQINSLSFTLGSTVIPEAIREAHKYFNLEGVRRSSEARRVAVFITDGHTHGGISTLQHPARELRSVSNARVVAFGVGPGNFINIAALKIMTGYEKKHRILHFHSTRDDSDDDDSDDDDSDDDDEELSRATRLICDYY